MFDIGPNGCTCHLIQTPGEPWKVCISCKGRSEAAGKGRTCSKCGCGVWGEDGDEKYMGGKCSHCYYEEGE